MQTDVLFKTKSFGIVVYMEDTAYSKNILANSSIHIPATKEKMVILLLKRFYMLKMGDSLVGNIVVGHEHGREKNKCHYQIFIEFIDKIYKTIRPGTIEDTHITYLYMAQHCKSPAKLREYCKKNNDFIEIFPDKKIKEILRENGQMNEVMDLDDPFDYMLKKTNLSEDNIKDIFKYSKISEYKRTFFLYSNKIFDTYKTYIKEDEKVPNFTWIFPEHIYNYLINNNNNSDLKLHIYSRLYDWFNKYCNIDPETVIRRKALFLFSIQGGLGKSFFARSLVPEISICNSPYYVYCRGTLDASEFKKKEKTARLVILDDINYIHNDIEIWKALAVSEPTNIRSPYYNFAWNRSLPCIFLSNNVKTLNYWLSTEDLKSRCVFIGINFYIGPPGTEILENRQVDKILSDDIEVLIKKLESA